MAELDWAGAFSRIHEAVRLGKCSTKGAEPYAIRERIRVRFGIQIIRKHLADGTSPYHLDVPDRSVMVERRYENIATGPFDTLARAEVAAHHAFVTTQAARVPVLEERIRQLENQFQGFVNDRG